MRAPSVSRPGQASVISIIGAVDADATLAGLDRDGLPVDGLRGIELHDLLRADGAGDDVRRTVPGGRAEQVDPALHGLIRARRTGGIDPLDGVSEKAWILSMGFAVRP